MLIRLTETGARPCAVASEKIASAKSAQVAQSERDRLASQVTDLDMQKRAAKMSDEALKKATADLGAARARLSEMEAKLREAVEQSARDQAEIDRLRRAPKAATAPAQAAPVI